MSRSKKHRREQRQRNQPTKPPGVPPTPPAESVKKPTGRQTILTPEIQAIIVEAAERGTPLTFCGPLAGVARSTLFNWMKWGAKAGTPYTAFVDAVKAAQARFVGERLTQIAQAKAWQAEAWLLERMFREEFGGDKLEINQLKKELRELRALVLKVPGEAPETAPETGGATEGGTDEAADSPASAG